MTTIKLHNTKTRKKEVFTPIDPDNVRMYVCGPTVYDRAHLGNARPVVVFDVLYRLLRHVYGPDHVTYVRNFTDVDDKINAEALRRQKAGDPRPLEALIHERTEETIGWYHADMDALGALRPSIKGEVSDKAAPRATQYIAPMIAMIETLIKNQNAYVVRDPSNNPPKQYVLFDHETKHAEHSLFSVDSYKEYGELSGRSVEDMIIGAKAEKAPNKRNPADFVLWKPSDDEQPGWESPWGRGRPGWHIECSAMADELLMKGLPENERGFDIHGGGIDLQFPHHENELAQSMCVHPEGGFANVWMHNEMLQVEGKKMSKSLGNFFTVRDLLDQGVPGEVIRMVFLDTNYGKPMDWTKEKAEQAEGTLRKWGTFARGIPATSVDQTVAERLAEDLNTHSAVAELHRIFKEGDAGKLRASAQLLGLMQDVHEAWLEPLEFQDVKAEIIGLVDPLVSKLTNAREQALISKDFKSHDALRNSLISVGVIPQLKDGQYHWIYTLQEPARARDKDAPTDGFLGATVYIAGWLRLPGCRSG